MVEPTPDRPVFKDRRLERRFVRDGYVVVRFAEPDELRQLERAYHAHDSGISSGYYADMHSRDADYKASVDRTIRDLLWTRLADLLVEHEPIVGAFMVKHPGEDSWVPPHQDWVVTDERIGGAVNCWFPVTPVGPDDGQMCVLRGSHRYLRGLRGSPAFPTEVGPISREIADGFLVPVPLDWGEAIIYENRLLHGTPPNRGERERIVAYMSAMPRGADRVHYYLRPDGTVEGMRVDRDFFVEFNIGERPDGEVFAEHPDYWIEPLTPVALAERHRRANGLLARARAQGYRDPSLLRVG